jgi:hypothetical protein
MIDVATAAAAARARMRAAVAASAGGSGASNRYVATTAQAYVGALAHANRVADALNALEANSAEAHRSVDRAMDALVAAVQERRGALHGEIAAADRAKRGALEEELRAGEALAQGAFDGALDVLQVRAAA